MLELRLTADAKRIASLRDAVGRECTQAGTSVAHGETVVSVVEQLVTLGRDAAGNRAGDRGRRAGRRGEILVVVTVQTDATLLMVRDSRPGNIELGARRQTLLEECATGWSTTCGREGRTIWAEIERAADPEPETRTLELPADAEPETAGPNRGAPGYGSPRDGERIDERVVGPGGQRLVPAGLRR